MTRPLRVFLCHSSNDKPTVRELYQKLRAESWIQPWLDEEELYPGQDWNMEIEKAVEVADAIIVCLTKGSITKEGYVQRELRLVLDVALTKPEDTIYVIPLRLEECELPRRLRAWQYADYFEGQRERAFQRLLVSLKRRADALGLTTEGLKEEPKKEIPAKPFTKLLDPSTLSPKSTSSSQDGKQNVRKFVPNNNIRWIGIGGIILLFLIFGGFGLNYLVKNLPVATATISSPTETQTIEAPTLTSVPITATPQPTKTSIPTPTLGIGSTMIGEKGETLVYVPAGEFTMGDGANDAPIHKVYLDAFWIDQTEVTNKQYKACMDAGMCEPPSSINSYTHPNYYGNPEFDDYPVIFVNWDKANRYCEVWTGTGGDLPTEAQWEKVARWEDARTYPWGVGWDVRLNKRLNFSDKNDPTGASDAITDDGFPDIAPVASYPSGVSPYGAYDMAGNVWEWVNDRYSKTYYKSSNTNPLGPESGNSRVVRGGSWNVSASYVRSALRNMYDPSVAYNNLGFRCARLP